MALVENVVTFYRKSNGKVITEGYKEFDSEDIEKTDKVAFGLPVYNVYITFDNNGLKISPLRFDAVKHPTKGLVTIYSGESIFK